MTYEFDKLVEKFTRIVEGDDGGAPPPDMGGGGAPAASEPQEPCFTNTKGIAFMVPFIRLYNKAKESGSLPDRVTKLMIANRSFLRDMAGERVKRKLEKIFRVSGISEVDIHRAQIDNKKKYIKVKENKDDVAVRPVGYSELKTMLDVLGTLADRVRDEDMHGLRDGSSPATEVEFPNKEEIDYANIWVAYNRIVSDVRGEYRSGV